MECFKFYLNINEVLKMKTKKKNKINAVLFLTFVAVPTILSTLATHYASVVLLIITIIGMLLFLKIPVFKHRENLWMFVIATFSTIPINIILVKNISGSFLFDNGKVIAGIFRGFVIYAVLFAVEQIVLGIITRFFYRKQYKLF